MYTALDGNLRLLNQLDYESSNKVYTLTILVQDLGTPYFSSTTQVTICVLDINDNGPTFTNNLMDFISIEENSEDDYYITTFDTTDPDEFPHNEATLSIVGGNQQGAFYLNESTNSLHVYNGSLLDYESEDITYTLTILAVDDGNNQFTDMTSVRYDGLLYYIMYVLIDNYCYYWCKWQCSSIWCSWI